MLAWLNCWEGGVGLRAEPSCSITEGRSALYLVIRRRKITRKIQNRQKKPPQTPTPWVRGEDLPPRRRGTAGSQSQVSNPTPNAQRSPGDAPHPPPKRCLRRVGSHQVSLAQTQVASRDPSCSLSCKSQSPVSRRRRRPAPSSPPDWEDTRPRGKSQGQAGRRGVKPRPGLNPDPAALGGKAGLTAAPPRRPEELQPGQGWADAPIPELGVMCPPLRSPGGRGGGEPGGHPPI